MVFGELGSADVELDLAVQKDSLKPKLAISFTHDLGDDSLVEMMEINYCPVCGRKLDETDNG